MPALATARSLLFAPGSDERKLRKALDVRGRRGGRRPRGRGGARAEGRMRARWSPTCSRNERRACASSASTAAGTRLARGRPRSPGRPGPRRGRAAEGDARGADRPRRARPAGGGDRRDGRRPRPSATRWPAPGPWRRCSSGPSTSALALGLEPRADGLELLVRALVARPGLRGSPVYAAPSTSRGLDVRDDDGPRGATACSPARSASAARRASTRRRCRS